MYKYLILFQKAFIKSIEYRTEILVWLILDILPTLVMLMIWIGIYQGKTEIGGYKLNQMLQYYLLAMVIEGITASHFESWRIDQIIMGKIDYFLTRPLSYLAEVVLGHFGGKFFYSMVSLPVFVLLWTGVSLISPIGLPHPNLLAVFWFMVLLILSSCINTLIALFIVLLGFWFEGAQGLEHFKWITLTLFSGIMVPISLMPIWLKNIVNFLPFKYLYAIPISVIQGIYQLTWQDVIYLFSFTGFLLLLNLITWKQAKYRYCSAGG